MISALVFLTGRMALNFVEALCIIFGFSLGYLLSSLIVGAIAKRAEVEKVPATLRGAPLVLISEGLLALVFSALTGIIIHSLSFFA
jgi:Na+-translocating ferredoxin:NAD+ oxidoreductase RnfA subunit